MAKQKYNKDPLSFTDQLEVLKKRNLTVDNDSKAISYLSQINYYRLSAYFLPFQAVKDKFDDGVTFSNVIDTYSFDRELRLLVFDSIERIEIAVRTQFVSFMSLKYNDSHWHDQKSLFNNPIKRKQGYIIDPYTDLQTTIRNAMSARRPEVFIKHYKDTYHTPVNPPSWMCFELLTMGDLSRIYRGLKNKSDKKEIAALFDLHPTIFTSWLHTLTYIRNICAHHSRLWNKELAIKPSLLLKPIGPWIGAQYNNPKRVFYFLCVLKYFLLRANPSSSMKDKLSNLIKKYDSVPIRFLGIPSDGKGNLLDWENEPLWQ